MWYLSKVPCVGRRALLSSMKAKMTICCPQGRDSLRRWWLSSQHVTTKLPLSCHKLPQGIAKLSKTCFQFISNCLKVVSQFSQSCSKVVPTLSQSCIKFSSQLLQSCLKKVLSQLSQSRLRVVKVILKMSQSCLKSAQNCFKVEWQVAEVAAIAWAQLRTGVNWESGMCQ